MMVKKVIFAFACEHYEDIKSKGKHLFKMLRVIERIRRGKHKLQLRRTSMQKVDMFTETTAADFVRSELSASSVSIVNHL